MNDVSPDPRRASASRRHFLLAAPAAGAALALPALKARAQGRPG